MPATSPATRTLISPPAAFRFVLTDKPESFFAIRRKSAWRTAPEALAALGAASFLLDEGVIRLERRA